MCRYMSSNVRDLVIVIFILVISEVQNLQYNKDTNGDVAVACQCVPSHMCQDHDKTSNGNEFLDIRFTDELGCKNYFEVCCNNPKQDTVTNIVNKELPSLKGCGYENPIGLSYRITGQGVKTQFGEAPWSIVVLQQSDDKSMYKCGGSLVSYQVVMTAAHCVAGMLDGTWTIRAGEWNTRSQEEPLPHQDRQVKEILIHPQFQSGSLKNDIALLFLSEAVTPAENVNFICLPPSNFPTINHRCVASGWGKDAFKKGKHSSVLKKVELPIVPSDKCLEALRATRLGKFYHLDKSFICAGGETNRDTCKGDGGSPLVCPVPGYPGRWVQLGIVSWGIGCGETNTPGVYVNVPLYRAWVDKQMEARGLDSSLYKYE